MHAGNVRDTRVCLTLTLLTLTLLTLTLLFSAACMRKTLVLLFVLRCMHACAGVGAVSTYYCITNYGIIGNLVGSRSGTTVATCAAWCDGTGGCDHFVMTLASGTCWLKNTAFTGSSGSTSFSSDVPNTCLKVSAYGRFPYHPNGQCWVVVCSIEEVACMSRGWHYKCC